MKFQVVQIYDSVWLDGVGGGLSSFIAVSKLSSTKVWFICGSNFYIECTDLLEGLWSLIFSLMSTSYADEKRNKIEV